MFTDAGQDAYSLNSPAVAEAIRPYPTNGFANVSLIPNGLGPSGILALTAIGLVILAITGFLTWRTRRQRRHHRPQPVQVPSAT